MTSRGREYFEQLYARNSDPWNFSHSAYEHDKYLATLDVLQGQHFVSSFEIGCSIGVLTKLLAPYCDALLAVDVVQTALNMAMKHCAGLGHVSFRNMHVPKEWPDKRKFDLIVISEVLYFLDTEDITRLAGLCHRALMPGGFVLLVNYTKKTEEPCGGDEAAQRFMAAAACFTCIRHVRRARFRIDFLRLTV